MQPFHHRMPVILPEGAVDDWLEPKHPRPLALKQILVPAAENVLTYREASKKVNNVANDGPELLLPDQEVLGAELLRARS